MKRRGDAGTGDGARVRRLESETAALASSSMRGMGMSAAQVFEVLGLSRSMQAVEALNGGSDLAPRSDKAEACTPEKVRAVSADEMRTDAPDVGIALA